MKIDKCKPRLMLLYIFIFVIPEGLIVSLCGAVLFMSHSLNQMRGLAWPLQEGPVFCQGQAEDYGRCLAQGRGAALLIPPLL